MITSTPQASRRRIVNLLSRIDSIETLGEIEKHARKATPMFASGPESSARWNLTDWMLEAFADRAESSITRYYLPSVRWLGEYIGREPLVSDMTLSNLLACYGDGKTPSRHFRALRAIWMAACDAGLVRLAGESADVPLAEIAGMSPLPHRTGLTQRVLEELAAMLGRDAVASDLTQANVGRLWKSWSKPLKTDDKRQRVNALVELAKFVGIAFEPHDPLRRTEPDPNEIGDQLTVRGLLIKHYIPRRLVGKSKSTWNHYEFSIRKFSRWLGRPAMLADLNDDTVSAFIQYLLTETSFAAPTIEKDVTQLLVLWRYAARRNMGPREPEIRQPRAPDVVPDAFTREELTQLLAACRSTRGTYAGVPAGLWWESLINVVFDSGERVGAILQVKWTDLSGEWLTVRAELRKGRQKARKYRLRPETVALLSQAKLSSASDVIFKHDFCHTHPWRTFGKILERAGLPNVRRGKFHKIRRTVATYFEQAGGDATKLLGHSSRRVTEKYLDESMIKSTQAVDLIASL